MTPNFFVAVSPSACWRMRLSPLPNMSARRVLRAREWPWPLTTLLAQAVAAWCAMIAAALLWCAHDLRRPREAFIPYATLGAWCLALLALPALHAADLTRTGAPLLTYLAALTALLAVAGLGVTRAMRIAR